MATGEHDQLERHDPAGHAADDTAPEQHEKPEDWGWHAEMGGLARGAGWVSAASLLLMNLGNHTRHAEDIWITVLALLLVLVLLLDRHRRKNSWRG